MIRHFLSLQQQHLKKRNLSPLFSHISIVISNNGKYDEDIQEDWDDGYNDNDYNITLLVSKLSLSYVVIFMFRHYWSTFYTWMKNRLCPVYFYSIYCLNLLNISYFYKDYLWKINALWNPLIFLLCSLLIVTFVSIAR